jgi:hypothetical protein
MNSPTARSLAIAYDATTDVVTIEGIRYAGELFRGIGIGPTERWFKIVKREDGLVTLTVAAPGMRLVDEREY